MADYPYMNLNMGMPRTVPVVVPPVAPATQVWPKAVPMSPAPILVQHPNQGMSTGAKVGVTFLLLGALGGMGLLMYHAMRSAMQPVPIAVTVKTTTTAPNDDKDAKDTKAETSQTTTDTTDTTPTPDAKTTDATKTETPTTDTNETVNMPANTVAQMASTASATAKAYQSIVKQGAPPQKPARQNRTNDTLYAGGKIAIGQPLVSANGKYKLSHKTYLGVRLLLEALGDVENPNQKSEVHAAKRPVWQTPSGEIHNVQHHGYYISEPTKDTTFLTVQQGDGNLVTYGAQSGLKYWESGYRQGAGRKPRTMLQNDGTLVTYVDDGLAVWKTDTVQPALLKQHAPFQYTPTAPKAYQAFSPPLKRPAPIRTTADALTNPEFVSMDRHLPPNPNWPYYMFSY